MTDTNHPTDALMDFVDGRLDSRAHAEVVRHVSACAQCQQEVAIQLAAKRAVARLPAPDVPEGLADQIEAAVTREGNAGASDERAASRCTRLTWLGLVATAAVFIIAALVFARRDAGLPESAAGAAVAHREGQLTLTTTLTDAVALNTDLGARAGFPVRVFDLGMMGYTLRGGRLWEIGGIRSALWVYQGAAGELVCQMFRGSIEDLPEPVERRTDRGFTFLIYHVGGETQVFWQEGDIVCVLASNLPAEDVIQLAIAKAMLP